MSKKTLTIVSASTKSPGAAALLSAAIEYGLDAQIAVIHTDDVVARVNSSDFVLFRVSPSTYTFYKEILPGIDARYQQKLQGFIAGFDKSMTYDVLKAYDIPTPPSYHITKGAGIRTYPAVIKVRSGNQGDGVALLRNESDYESFIAEYDQPSYLVQTFIEEATGHDTRILIAGGELIGAMKRSAVSDDFRANLHQGGHAETYIPSEQEIVLAKRAARAFNLDLVGVDILESSNGPLVLEVNPSPGLAIGEVIGVNVAKKIIEELFHD